MRWLRFTFEREGYWLAVFHYLHLAIGIVGGLIVFFRGSVALIDWLGSLSYGVAI